jgi:hypothetical protein
MVYKANSEGVFHWNSDNWDGYSFNSRPAGFYTVGGFTGHYNRATGEVKFEDVYDWHRMVRTSPDGLGTAEVWCWSEYNLPTIQLELLVKHLPSKLQGVAVRLLQKFNLQEFNVGEFAEDWLGTQYVGDSDFFGIRGVSNKLWHDLQSVGAKSFKTVWSGKYSP